MTKTSRTTFITSLGWFAILASILGGFGGAIQLLGHWAMSAGDESVRAAILESVRLQAGPSLTESEVENFLLRNGEFAIANGLPGVVAGIGLLRRREWARKLSIALIALVTLALLASVAPLVVAAGFGVRGGAYGLFAVLLTWLHWRIIVRLRSAETRAQFVSTH